MVYQIIFKRRFQSKLEKLLVYIEQEFGLLVAKKFAGELENKLSKIQRYPFIGQQSTPHKNVRSILFGNHNRFYYRIEEDKLIVLNMYDTRINPMKHKLK